MILTIVVFILVLGLLVFVHEFGHFIAAKKMGVQVDEFGLGFPPQIIGIKKNKTIYSLNLIPLGGFVKIKGEMGEAKEDKDSFVNKKIWQKSLILSSGVLMNFITAVILISIGFMIGSPLPISDAKELTGAKIRETKIQVVSILENSPAQKAELNIGDIILSLNNQTFSSLEELQNYVNSIDGTVKVNLKRGDEEFEKMITTEKLSETSKYGIGVGLVQTGIISFPWYLAIWHGFERSVFLTKEVILAFYNLFKNLIIVHKVTVDISGPVGIAVITGEVAKLGFVYLLQFTALLSINLAVINFLPFPALDGSRIVFLIIEKIRRKEINRKIENLTHAIGFTALIILMILVTYLDIVKYGGKAWNVVVNFFS